MRCYICIDNRNGMAFNDRRESRDSKVVEDILNETKKRVQTLLIEDYSAELFEGYNWQDNIKVVNSFQETMAIINGKVDVFTELWDPSDKGFDEYVIYKWNRDYPYDLYFSEKLQGSWNLIESIDFIGTSHEKITRETWRR